MIHDKSSIKCLPSFEQIIDSDDESLEKESSFMHQVESGLPREKTITSKINLALLTGKQRPHCGVLNHIITKVSHQSIPNQTEVFSKREEARRNEETCTSNDCQNSDCRTNRCYVLKPRVPALIT